ncbi:MAG TPA: hypothetical protein VF086_19260 [Propionibacteriaceae bacterium]
MISIFGILAGLAAIEHAIGEISQGSIRPLGLLIQSWPNVAAFDILAGEPALTVLPNLLLSGVLTVIIAVALAVWSVAFVHRPGGGLVLILLSALLLLVGGGLGPPLLGMILGVSAVRMHSVPRRAPRRFLLPLARIWPWIMAVGVAGYLALLPGTVLLYYFAGVANDTLVYALTFISFAALILSLVAARAADQIAFDHGNDDGRPAQTPDVTPPQHSEGPGSTNPTWRALVLLIEDHGPSHFRY